MAALKAELAGPTPSPLERLVIERVAATFDESARSQLDMHYECRVIWPDESVHWIESHASFRGGGERETRLLGFVADTTDRKQLTFIYNGVKTDVDAHPDDTVLEAGEFAGLDLPYSCRGGVCATCRAKVLEGAVEMDHNYALEPWETDAGFVLTCQSHPTTDRLVVDYDAV